MSWQEQLKGDALTWLLEEDTPGVRYLALRDLLGRGEQDPELVEARDLAHARGEIADVLDEMDDHGYWMKPGPGYLPKYRSTVWSVILLAQLGARLELDKRIEQACDYLLENALAKGGQFSMSGPPSGTIDCLQGNLLWALTSLGYDDPRLEAAFEWMARTVTGEGLAPLSDKHAPMRYYGGKSGPNFACGANAYLPCAWGGTKVMLAFGLLPEARRTPLIRRAIQAGVDFFLAGDPSLAAYPNGWSNRASSNWWKFGFPVFYVTDILQIAEAMLGLSLGADPRLANTLALIRGKQDAQGRWALEYDYSGKTWVDFGEKKQPNKWVTLRALRVLKAAGAN